MNRLHHIRETLPANIADNKSYEKLEFVLLDYNSSDGLADWVHENYPEELDSGRLVFKRTDTPSHFDWSHSKNIAFRLASGDIVCNLDADNFAGRDFAFYINNHFRERPQSYLSVDYQNNFNHLSDLYGRIACYKHDFETLGGFDESMKGYGYEDIDFCLRLNMLQRKQYFITDKKFHKTISHGSEDRFDNTTKVFGVKDVLINYLSPFCSKILFLFADGRCSYGTLLDKNEGMGNPTIQEKRWLIGSYEIDDHHNINIFSPEFSLNLSFHDGHYEVPGNGVFYKITDKNYLQKLQAFYSIIGNHQVLVNNIKTGKVKVNLSTDAREVD